jgi:hypothetical protein
MSPATIPAKRVFKGDLINKTACRRFLLDHARQTRYHEFKRVDPSVYAQANGLLRAFFNKVVMRNPSCGKTLR